MLLRAILFFLLNLWIGGVVWSTAVGHGFSFESKDRLESFLEALFLSLRCFASLLRFVVITLSLSLYSVIYLLITVVVDNQ